MRHACDEAAADRIADLDKDDRYGARHLLQRLQRLRGHGQDDVRFQPDKLDRIGPYAFGLGTAPAIVDAYVAALCPTQFFKCLPERRHIGLRIRIVLGKGRQYAHAPHPLALLRSRRERPRRRRAEQRDERAALHVDFALPLIASPSSACHPALLIFTRATSVILPSVAMRSACADASPARTSSISSSAVNPFANISASVEPSGEAASSSRARRRSGLGPWRRWGWGMVWRRWWLGTWLVRLTIPCRVWVTATCGSSDLAVESNDDEALGWGTIKRNDLF